MVLTVEYPGLPADPSGLEWLIMVLNAALACAVVADTLLPRAAAPAGELHLIDLGAHWVQPGLRPRFAPLFAPLFALWAEISTELRHDRLRLIGYPGEKKALTPKLPLSPQDRGALEKRLGRRL